MSNPCLALAHARAAHANALAKAFDAQYALRVARRRFSRAEKASARISAGGTESAADAVMAREELIAAETALIFARDAEACSIPAIQHTYAELRKAQAAVRSGLAHVRVNAAPA
jgi:hypothetical protein